MTKNGVREVTLGFTGAMVIQILSIGTRGILEKPIWAGEAIFFFLTLLAWLISGILDTIKSSREMEARKETWR